MSSNGCLIWFVLSLRAKQNTCTKDNTLETFSVVSIAIRLREIIKCLYIYMEKLLATKEFSTLFKQNFKQVLNTFEIENKYEIHFMSL